MEQVVGTYAAQDLPRMGWGKVGRWVYDFVLTHDLSKCQLCQDYGQLLSNYSHGRKDNRTLVLALCNYRRHLQAKHGG